MSMLRRLGIHKVCLRRRASTSHLLRHFWCFAVLKLRFFVPARTKSLSILTYSQGFGHLRAKKIASKPYVFLCQPAWAVCFLLYIRKSCLGARIEKHLRAGFARQSHCALKRFLRIADRLH